MGTSVTYLHMINSRSWNLVADVKRVTQFEDLLKWVAGKEEGYPLNIKYRQINLSSI